MIFLGIDQTGAINSRGEPRPLPACLLQDHEVVLFYLKELSLERIESFVSKDEMSSLRVAVDCVLGLPSEVKIPWRLAIKKTIDYTGFGRKPAQSFFGDLGRGLHPRRQVEILCHANSVFRDKPFQKNIQTGTFRIWKEIAQDEGNFYAPLLERKNHSKSIPLYEGYPSLAWKLLLETKSRRPQEISMLLKKTKTKVKWTQFHQNQVEKDENLADALLLALSLKKFLPHMEKRKPHAEGWILGADSLLEEKNNE